MQARFNVIGAFISKIMAVSICLHMCMHAVVGPRSPFSIQDPAVASIGGIKVSPVCAL